MTSVWAVALAGGFVGSLHCAAMCGPLVACACSGSKSATTQAAYQLGRLLSYLTLGAVAGAFGRAVDLAGDAAGIGRVASLVAGFSMVAFAVGALLGDRSLFGGATPARKNPLARAAGSALARLSGLSPALRAGALGLCSALLPCGLLYGVALAAAATASSLNGAVVLAALWLGTLPMLAGLGAVLARVTRSSKAVVTRASAVVLLILGGVTLVERIDARPFAAAAAAFTAPREGAAAATKPDPQSAAMLHCPLHAERGSP